MENDQIKKELNISNVLIKLLLDTESAKNKLSLFYKDVKQTMEWIKNDVQKAFDPMCMAFDFLISAAEYGADEVKKITEGALNSDMDISEFSILANIFKMLGGNAEEAGLELKNISDQVEAMRNEAAKDISLGGITVSLYDDENNLKKPKQIFQDIQKELWKIQDASKRANIIENMGFGRTMSKLLNLDESAYLRKEIFAKKRGIVSPEHQSSLDMYNEASARIKQHYDQFASEKMTEFAVLLDTFADAMDYFVETFEKFKEIITLGFIALGSAVAAFLVATFGSQFFLTIAAGIPYLIALGTAAFTAISPFLLLGATIAACAFIFKNFYKGFPMIDKIFSGLNFNDPSLFSFQKADYTDGLKFQDIKKYLLFPIRWWTDNGKEKIEDQETSSAIPPMAPLQTSKEMENNYAPSVNSNTADNSKTTNISQENKIYVTVNDARDVQTVKNIMNQQASALV